MQMFGKAKIMEKANVFMESSVSGAKSGTLGSKNNMRKDRKASPMLIALIKTRKHREKRITLGIEWMLLVVKSRNRPLRRGP